MRNYADILELEWDYVLRYGSKFWTLDTSQGDRLPQIQDSGAQSHPETLGQSRTDDSQRCSGVAPR